MEPLKIALVDDSAQDRASLQEKIVSYMTQQELEYTLFEFPCGEDFLASLSMRQYDLVFMDIYMTGITGVETATRLRMQDRNCLLVFLTATPEFMPQGFALNSRHYILKPATDEAFLQAMENCKIVQPQGVPALTVEFKGEEITVATKLLAYIDIVDRNAILHMAQGEVCAGRVFASLCAQLEQDARFLLCLKGVLVNMDYIVKEENNAFLLKNGEQVLIAPRRKTEILKTYRNYIFSRARAGNRV